MESFWFVPTYFMAIDLFLQLLRFLYNIIKSVDTLSKWHFINLFDDSVCMYYDVQYTNPINFGVRCILLRQTLTLQFPFSMCLYVTMPNRIMHATATQYNTKQVFIQFASLQWWRSSIVITLVIQTHTTVQISARMTLITWTMVIGPFHFLTSTPSSYSS